jgi:hypothetical protein
VESASWTSLNGSKLGSCSDAGYTGTVFEPIDEYKGDFARTYFYMSTRYYTEDSSWPGSPMTTGSQLKPWALQMMLNWSAQDPVSEKETNRNNSVYIIQHNRNPFIDHPEFANNIWGFPVGTGHSREAFSLRIYPNPCGEFCIVELPSAGEGQIPAVVIIAMNGSEWYPEFKNAGPELTINLRSLPAGIYCLMLKSDKGIWYSRLVKE